MAVVGLHFPACLRVNLIIVTEFSWWLMSGSNFIEISVNLLPFVPLPQSGYNEPLRATRWYEPGFLSYLLENKYQSHHNQDCYTNKESNFIALEPFYLLGFFVIALLLTLTPYSEYNVKIDILFPFSDFFHYFIIIEK